MLFIFISYYPTQTGKINFILLDRWPDAIAVFLFSYFILKYTFFCATLFDNNFLMIYIFFLHYSYWYDEKSVCVLRFRYYISSCNIVWSYVRSFFLQRHFSHCYFRRRIAFYPLVSFPVWMKTSATGRRDGKKMSTAPAPRRVRCDE